MMKTLVLDACALIAFLNDEAGANIVEGMLEEAKLKIHELVMNSINLLEIYYGVYRDDGHEAADSIMEIIGQLPIRIVYSLADEVFLEAGRLKAKYRISLADSIALAEANIRNTELVTADHHEFDVLVAANEMKAFWIR